MGEEGRGKKKVKGRSGRGREGGREGGREKGMEQRYVTTVVLECKCVKSTLTSGMSEISGSSLTVRVELAML